MELEFTIGDIVEERSQDLDYLARYIVIGRKEFANADEVAYTLYTIWSRCNASDSAICDDPGTIDYLMSYELNEGKSVIWKII